jgi:hypothetical protein
MISATMTPKTAHAIQYKQIDRPPTQTCKKEKQMLAITVRCDSPVLYCKHFFLNVAAKYLEESLDGRE